MKTTTLIIGSVTYAIKARKTLARANILSELIKIEDTVTGMGCAYGIKFNSNDYYSVVNILKNSGIIYRVHSYEQ